MAVIDNQLILAEQLNAQADRDDLNRIVGSIDALDGIEALPRPIPLTFVGAAQRQTNILYRRVDVIGTSWLAFGVPWRTGYFLRTMGLNRFVIVKPESDAFKAQVAQMPIWPAKGSIRIVDGVVAVKLGP
jgi:hypothetical protein